MLRNTAGFVRAKRVFSIKAGICPLSGANSESETDCPTARAWPVLILQSAAVREGERNILLAGCFLLLNRFNTMCLEL